MRAPSVVTCVVLVAFVGLQFCALGMPPDQRGPYSFWQYEVELHDEARNRSMGLLIYYPLGDEALALQSRPLIVFNHGFLLSSLGYRSYGEHLASHGFVVALPSLPTSFFTVHHVRLAEDVRYVIDYLVQATSDKAHPLFGTVDAERIGGSGHSLGGKLSLLEAVTDNRVKAIAVLDPVDEGNPIWNNPARYPSVAPELMPELEVPLLFVGAELGSVLITFSPCAPEDENYQQFYEAADSPAIEITQLDVGHGQYVDDDAADENDPCARGEVPSEWVRSSSAAYLTAFFLGHLGDSPDALDWLEARLLEEQEAGLILVRRKS